MFRAKFQGNGFFEKDQCFLSLRIRQKCYVFFNIYFLAGLWKRNSTYPGEQKVRETHWYRVFLYSDNELWKSGLLLEISWQCCINWILCAQRNTLMWNLFFKKKLKFSSTWGSKRKRFSCFVEWFLGGLQKSILNVGMIVLGKMVMVCLENSCLWLPSNFQSKFLSFEVQVSFARVVEIAF